MILKKYVMKKRYVFYFLLGLSNVILSQTITITNVGSKITVTDGITLDFDNLHNSQTGSVFNYDTDLDISGNWTNIAPATFNQGENGSLTLNGTSQQTIASGGSKFRKLTVNNTTGNNAEILLSDNLEVKTSLILTDGIINTNSHTLIFQSTATSNSGNAGSFVDGVVEKTDFNSSFIFPTGHVILRDIGSGDQTYKIWAPIGLDPGAQTTVNARYYFSNQGLHEWWYHDWTHEAPLTHTSDREYWIVNSSSDLEATLYWKDNDPCSIHDFCEPGLVFNSGYLTVAYWNNIWIDAGGTASSNYAEGSITSSSDIPFVAKGEKQITFGALNNDIPLPVELLNFVSVCSNSHVELLWTTASETNNDYFVLEKSKDAINWIEIANIDGAGNSNSLLNYNYIDQLSTLALSGVEGLNFELSTFNFQLSTNFYRLKQVDFDGNFSYSDIIQVSCQDNLQDNLIEIISIYPNPAHNDFNYDIFSTQDREIIIFVINVLGKNIIREHKYIKEGFNQYSLNVSALAAGVYYFKIETVDGLNNDSKQILIK
jgi:hypothetical protein